MKITKQGTIPSKISSNSVSLAGEFAVLSQLALRGLDANMTLGRTKGVDILVSDPSNGRMLKLEVKTNHQSSRSAGGNSKLFGKFESAWLMSEKHEQIRDPNLFYCFVNIGKSTKHFRFFIVPSVVVADYVKREHLHWKNADRKHSGDSKMRNFRLCSKSENCPIPTPGFEDFEDNWDFEPLS